MAGTLPPIKVEIVANTAPFTKSLTAAAQALEKIAAVAKGASEGLDLVAAAVDRVTEPLAAMAEAAKSARTQLSGIASATKRIATSAEAAGKAVQENFTVLAESADAMSVNVKTATTEAGTAIAAMGEEAKSAGLGLASMGEDIVASMKAAATEIRAASVEMRESMATVAATAKKTAAESGASMDVMESKFLGLEEVLKELKTWGPLSLGAIAVESARMDTKFQAAMTQINTQAGVAKSKLAGLGNGVLALAGQVGFSPDSLAEALFHVESSFASTGITGQKAMEILRIASEGAAVGHANLVDVQNALDAAIASGIPGVQNFSQAMGALNAIIGAGDMQMQDLANALGTGVLAVVKGYGLTLNDVGAALATFGDNNIRGAVAATDLRMAVQALAVPSKAGIELLGKWGQSADSLSKDMQSHGLVYTLNQLHDLFVKNGVTATTQGQIITEMFGKKAGSGLAVLMGQLDRVNSKVPDLAKGASGFADAWVTAQHTLSQQLNDMKAGFDSLMIKIGEGVVPALSGLITLIETRGAPAFHSVSSAFGGFASGITGSAQKQQSSGGPNLGGWAQAGAQLRSIFGDLGKIIGQFFQILGNVARALAPLAALIGGAFLVALKAVTALIADYLGPVLVTLSGFLAKNKDLITILLGAFVAWKVAAAATAVQTMILNAVMDANPIMLVVTAMALLTAAVIMLWQHSQTAREVLSRVFAVLGITIINWVEVSLEAFKLIIEAFLSFVTAMVDGAAKAFGWIPGIGPKLKKAAADLQGYTDDSNKFFDSALGKVNQWAQQLNNLPATVDIQGNIDDLTKKINDAKAQLDDKNLPSSKKLTLVADITNWQRQVLQAKLQLANTPSAKRAVLTATITDWRNQINQATEQLKNAPASKRAVLTAEISALQSSVAAATRAIESIPDRTVTIYYNGVNEGSVNPATHQYTSTTGQTYAMGGIHIPGLRTAATGLMARQAGFASSPILWAEAGPEAYIPLDRGKRPRSRQIASETVHMLGGQVSWDGGRSMVMAPAAPSGSVTPAGAGPGDGQFAGQLPPIIVQVDGKKLFEITQVQAGRYNRRNPTNGLTVTNR